jgi:hypothetical protein
VMFNSSDLIIGFIVLVGCCNVFSLLTTFVEQELNPRVNKT